MGPTASRCRAREALANLKDHIDAVVKHYKGQVIGWDVVNEAISDNPKRVPPRHAGKKAIGDDYIAKAFQFAHEADPDAELYYNDYSNENPGKRDSDQADPRAEEGGRADRRGRAAGALRDAVRGPSSWTRRSLPTPPRG